MKWHNFNSLDESRTDVFVHVHFLRNQSSNRFFKTKCSKRKCVGPLRASWQQRMKRWIHHRFIVNSFEGGGFFFMGKKIYIRSREWMEWRVDIVSQVKQLSRLFSFHFLWTLPFLHICKYRSSKRRDIATITRQIEFIIVFVMNSKADNYMYTRKWPTIILLISYSNLFICIRMYKLFFSGRNPKGSWFGERLLLCLLIKHKTIIISQLTWYIELPLLCIFPKVFLFLFLSLVNSIFKRISWLSLILLFEVEIISDERSGHHLNWWWKSSEKKQRSFRPSRTKNSYWIVPTLFFAFVAGGVDNSVKIFWFSDE